MKNLNEKEFQMLLDGLDALPHAKDAGMLMMDMFMMSVIGKDPEAKEEYLKERKMRQTDLDIETKAMKAEIETLKAKLTKLRD